MTDYIFLLTSIVIVLAGCNFASKDEADLTLLGIFCIIIGFIGAEVSFRSIFF